MLDVHPAPHAASTWREFFIHIGTIVLGLLIAVSLEQTVEYVHRRHEAREARETIQKEMAKDLPILQSNLQQLKTEQQQFAMDLDLLNSGASDAEVLHNLEFGTILARPDDAAWNAAKINGSLALIPPGDIANASYFYESRTDIRPTDIAYFVDLGTAESLLDHARVTGKLTASDRQQLLSLTVSCMGHTRIISAIFSDELHALQSNGLQ
jgi:hypothetical protein